MRTVLLAVVCILSPPLLAYGAARAVGYDGHQVERDGPQVPRETTAELLEAAVRGCAAAGGRASTGIQAGVVISRCQPAALPHLGVLEVRR